MKRLIKIYQDNAVFLINNDRIIVEKITGDALEILDFYILNYGGSLELMPLNMVKHSRVLNIPEYKTFQSIKGHNIEGHKIKRVLKQITIYIVCFSM